MGLIRTHARTALIAFGVLSASLAWAAEDPWAELRRVPVQEAGRVKPLDTFARETARRLTGARAFGAESVAGLDPVEWLVAAWADPGRWREERMIRVSDAALRALAALPANRDRFSFAELAGYEPFVRAAEEARQESAADSDVRLSPPRQAALRLLDDLVLLDGVLKAEVPAVLAGGSDGSWRSFATLAGEGASDAGRVSASHRDLLSAYRARDRAGLFRAAQGLARALQEAHPQLAGELSRLDREVDYNALKPFRLAWALYLLALLPLLSSFPLRSRGLTAIGYATLLAGFLVQSYGLVLRTLVAGRAPVTNMYESIVFAAWGAVGLGLAWELRSGARLFASCAAGVAVPLLLVADAVPMFDSAIDPLSPVLRDNFWLTSHVLTITLGYAALFLAVAIGHVSLALQLRHAELGRVRTVSNFLHRVMQAGTLLLAAGTLLGGVWASYSWGRFWGWDPKETWALIALLVYLAILHARFAGWMKDLGLAIGSIAGGLAVLMAWYGVNYVLGTGLHSYGFGSGDANAWVLGFVACEIGVMALCAWRLRTRGVPSLQGYTLADTTR
jgi:cytochrome c-type biogenesis protein CcsB